jgi:drug/metabolite transporter (DMT)-like permease
MTLSRLSSAGLDDHPLQFTSLQSELVLLSFTIRMSHSDQQDGPPFRWIALPQRKWIRYYLCGFVVNIALCGQNSMIWILFALGAALSWGLYGPTLHRGQVQLGNPLRALLCVGVAYFLIGVLFPLAMLWSQGEVKGFSSGGVTLATVAGALGAVGAICIIYAFRVGGLPTYVMPLVFGGAPLVNVLFSMWLHPPKTAPNPLLYVGFAMVAAGAGLVLYFKPSS